MDKARGVGLGDTAKPPSVARALSVDKAWGWGPTPLKKDDIAV